MSSQSVFFFFIDGLGLARSGPHNPLGLDPNEGLSELADCENWTSEHFLDSSQTGLLRRSIDARLGIEGLPQSGTGQATIFSGINCAELAGRHYGPYPHSTSKPILASSNLYHKAGAHHCAFANAYPERFFSMSKKRDRWSTTTRCCLDAGVRIRTMEDLASGQAIAADLTGAGLSSVSDSTVIPVTQEESAQRIVNLCESHRLVVAEYFHSDKAGHKQSQDMATSCLRSISAFFSGLMRHMDFSTTSVVVTSDHGNMEDLSTKSHTLNPVPLVVRGPAALNFEQVRDLTGVADAIANSVF